LKEPFYQTLKATDNDATGSRLEMTT